MELIIVLSFIFVVFGLVCEAVTLSVFKRPIFKEIDLSESELNPLNKKILSIRNKSGANFITTVPISLFFPYYVSMDNYKTKRTILRFSKNYFLIRKKYKELGK